MRRYLDPTEVAQAVQLLQDGTSIHAIARRFAVSPISRTGICSFVQGGTG